MTHLKLETRQGSQEEPKTEAQRNVSVPQPEPTPASITPRTTPAPGWQTGLKRCFDTVATPLSSLAELGGLHGFAPLPLDKEFVKAAGILEKFTTIGMYLPTLPYPFPGVDAHMHHPSTNPKSHKNQTLRTQLSKPSLHPSFSPPRASSSSQPAV
jgi:hypothetical protein